MFKPIDNESLAVKISAYENDDLTDDESVVLFQHLIDTGLAWKLQGHYGRTSVDLITRGLCRPKISEDS